MKYGPAELAETFQGLLRSLAGALDGLEVPWMLVGGLAVGAWTEPRGTKDCDIALEVPLDSARLAEALEGIGLAAFRGDLERARTGGSVRLRLEHPDAPPLVVDLLCAGTEFEAEALSRRMTVDVLGVRTPVVSPDDLVVYKLIAGRPQDLADVDKLFRFGRAPADEARVRRWAREWEVEDRLDRALRAAQRSDD